MMDENFKWLVTKLDDPRSVLNDPRLETVREIMIQKLSECDKTVLIDEITGDIFGIIDREDI